MIVQDVFDSLRPQSSLSRLAGLLNDILALEDRLSRPDDQSVYFRWGLSNHKAHLKKLHRQYSKFRYHFNDHTVDDFLDELNGRKAFLRDVVPSIESRNVRYIAKTDSVEIIAEMKDMVVLKGIVDTLPDLDELRMNSAVWEGR